MSFNIVFIVIALLAAAFILSSVRKGKLSIDESFFWFIGAIAMLVLAIFPKIIDKIAVWAGVDYPPSLLFVGCIVFLILINVRLTKKVSVQQEKIISLAQDMAILKNDKKLKK